MSPEDTEGHETHFEKYHEFITDIYKEELEQWITENRIININLKNKG